MTTLFRRKAVAVAFAALALTLAGGGIAVAQPAAQTPAEVAQPARQPGSGSQPAVTPAEAAKAKAALAQGPSALATTPGTVASAVVTSGGILLRGSPEVVSATRYGPGQYQVLFNYNVSLKAIHATIGTIDPFNVPPGGEISVAPRLQTPNAVFVQTRNSSGGPSDRPFHLVVAN
ncbi:hypothetical protein OG777_04495 [Micromonospora peucetia]|uniref:Secreted protein n=1 Tax=Micromonospora peucetia TaxID=47871 RepID=A0ABZ1EHF6_9ACTN|nr:hypothetical protein [Micromonospora peucetia]MCX4386185.1 hypothetical protein [Micromonospora peucetia]WSA33540.1 hypothetical protein OIE14_05680 [Micromonospora peucetia]